MSIIPREIYPAIEPFDSGFLRVSPVHQIYYEQSGNPQGKPVVFIHGGPGGGTVPKMAARGSPVRLWQSHFEEQRECHRWIERSRATCSFTI